MLLFEDFLCVKLFDNMVLLIEYVVQWMLQGGQYVWVKCMFDKEFLDVVVILMWQVGEFGFGFVLCFEWMFDEFVKVCCDWVKVIVVEVQGDVLLIDLFVLQIKGVVQDIQMFEELMQMLVWWFVELLW